MGCCNWSNWEQSCWEKDAETGQRPLKSIGPSTEEDKRLFYFLLFSAIQIKKKRFFIIIFFK